MSSRRSRADFTRFFHDLDVDGNDQTALHFVPVSALAGDNVVHASAAMPWYSGPTLLGLLESIPSSQVNLDAPFRMAVQRVVRPDLDFRGFAGQIASGLIRGGDAVTALPSGRSSRVRRIVTFDGDLPQAFAPLSVTLTLEDEIDISRGDVLASSSALPTVSNSFTASIVWMSETPLDLSRRYLLKHGSRAMQAQVKSIVRVVDLAHLAGQVSAPKVLGELSMNGIADVALETLQPLAFDSYAANRHTGSFVLIDLQSNATVAAGMIRNAAVTAAAVIEQTFREITLKPAHTLRLQGTEEAIATAVAALRSANVLQEEQ